MAKFAGFLIIAAFLAIPCSAQAESVEPYHELSLGATYIGAHIHLGFGSRWAAEARTVSGHADSTSGRITANSYGLRAYRYFRAPSRIRFFLGAEGALTTSSARQNNYKTNGTAFGAFAGTEIYATRRLSIGLDAGPYFLVTKVRNTSTSETGVEFVVNSSLNFYFL